MKPVQIEFLMVDHLSARLDKAVGKIERMSQQASSANRQIRELDRSGSLLNNTVGKLAAAFTIKGIIGLIRAAERRALMKRREFLMPSTYIRM